MRQLEVLIEVPIPEQLQLQRPNKKGAPHGAWIALMALLVVAYSRQPQQEISEIANRQAMGSEAKNESSVAVIVREPEAEVSTLPQESAAVETTVPPALSVPAENRLPTQSRPPGEKANVRPTPPAIANKSSTPASRVAPPTDETAVNSVDVPTINPTQVNPGLQVAESKSGVRTVTSEFLAGKLIRKVVPAYPALARRNRIAGTVILRAIISEKGTIRELRVESGPALLIDAAKEAVRQWEYKPWILDGKPIEMESTIDVIFKLRSTQDTNSTVR